MLTEPRPDVLAALRACRFLRTASTQAIDELARGARVFNARRGDLLAREGDAATDLGVVVTGRVRVYYLGADGRQITFETLEPGDAYSAVAALANGRNPANVEAATPATIALVSGEALFAQVEHEPHMARALIGDLATRVVNFTSVVQTLAMDVPSRLARYIFQRTLSSGRPTPQGVEVDLGMKKGDLASALGTVPETLSRAFAKLRDDELIEVHGSTVVVRDVRALAALGSGLEEG